MPFTTPLIVNFSSLFHFYFGDPMCCGRRHYGFFKFCGDVIMTLFTAGLWLIWVFVREMRYVSNR